MGNGVCRIFKSNLEIDYELVCKGDENFCRSTPVSPREYILGLKSQVGIPVVWCVVCGVWCVVCGVWCVVCGVWCVVCGVQVNARETKI